jgi:hypothetical protein
MSQFRFHIQAGPEMVTTPWEDETVKVGHGTTAGERITALRAQYGPQARISVERLGDNRVPNILPMFRYKIYIPSGVVPVNTPEGVEFRAVKNLTLQSNPFYEPEREKVVAEIREKFPKAILTEEKVG